MTQQKYNNTDERALSFFRQTNSDGGSDPEAKQVTIIRLHLDNFIFTKKIRHADKGNRMHVETVGALATKNKVNLARINLTDCCRIPQVDARQFMRPWCHGDGNFVPLGPNHARTTLC